VDWLGINRQHLQGGQPLHRLKAIQSLLQQLDHTRQAADRRCLKSAIVVGAEDEAMAPIVDDDQPIEESTTHTQLPHTQLPFGTQIAHPLRSRARDEEPEFLGINRKEPVLAGNTQRADIQSTGADTEYEARTNLLGLIYGPPKPNHVKPKITSPPGFVRTALSKPHSIAEPPTGVAPRRPASAEAQSTISRAEPEHMGAASPPMSGREPPLDPEIIASSVSGRPGQELPAPQGMERNDSVGANTLSDACVWMKGLVFNREALVVDGEQRNILQKETSWHQPQPGVIAFPDGNMPIGLLQRFGKIADDLAAAEHNSSSESEMADGPSPELVVPPFTPDLPPATSQISWSASPSPEPSNKPGILRTGLPPDSSFETQVLAPNGQRLNPDLQHDQSDNVQSVNQREPSAPPSSPPVRNLPADSDDEMEMEESVPYGLGEDAAVSRPVVQVNDTPYPRAKTSVLFEVSPQQKQDSSGNSKDTSGTSIVYGTYSETHAPKTVGYQSHSACEGDNQAPHQAVGAEQQLVSVPDSTPDRRNVQYMSRLESLPHAQSNSRRVDDTIGGAVLQGREDFRGSVSPCLSPTSKSGPASSNNKVSSSMQSAHVGATSLEQNFGPIKRKLGDSPPRSHKQRSKRREIKIVGFGDDLGPSIDPASVLRKDRAESLRKFREQREISNRNEDGLDSIDRAGLGARQIAQPKEIVTSNDQRTSPSSHPMSPRHRSLYDEASPTKSPSMMIRSYQPGSRDDVLATQPQLAISTGLAERDTMAKRVEPSTLTDVRDLTTVYQMFKAAYPEYTGDVNHFRRQCQQMYQLDQEDKMVPKWQWDDFIIRNRTDYKDYALDCVERGDNPEPYHRFYKDTIRDTLYRQGIVESKGTLLRALEELDAWPQTLDPPGSMQEPPRRNHNPSRTSLPSTFKRPEKPFHNHLDSTPRNRPRQSLPGGSHNHLPLSMSRLDDHASRHTARKSTIVGSQHSPRPSVLSGLECNPTSRLPSSCSETESTGDPYRDFVFGLQRATSWTGTSKVSPRSDGSNRQKS
jgi:hypothetical protein